MDKSFSSDKPITSKTEDRFQRYNFSERIAKTIIERESEDCIAIGIYGVWGEGKTSVLNFIEAELKKNENIVIIQFNPWRYKNEDSLLLQFFQKLASALNASLKTKKEKAGELFAPTRHSTAHPEPYKSNFSKDYYSYFTSIFDKDLFKKYILKNFREEEISESAIIWEEHRGKYQTDINIVRQFMHWYNESSMSAETASTRPITYSWNTFFK